MKNAELKINNKDLRLIDVNDENMVLIGHFYDKFTSFSIEETFGSDVVELRDLHGELEITEDFNKWRNRVVDENNIKVVVPTREMTGEGGKWITRYYVSLRDAKAIAMMTMNDAGTLARSFFILASKLSIPNL
ncbi:hypothetical protein C9J48_04160 [Photobacterium profundum]|uniref:AntA/AntB antirepressor domain-containing protein n=1 Tax=Photobacterium profundum 3TCK TaxID=314280 RepID=Q1Z7H7_9GAMM|nr:antA/AntB antirepressor family protein [Photobacterium profundum]EAS44482.1 hypothetical protein P3TCK_15035 [Photobacterium profundum 3TCK]PSV64654.1 hypothetical protein C9J48_04160 [Photobacterium profundum]